MTAAVDDLARRSVGWLQRTTADAVVISSRIRLARNLRKVPFPGQAGAVRLDDVWCLLSRALCDCPTLQPALAIQTSKLPELERQILFERQFISAEMTQRGTPCGLVIGGDGHLGAMVNEEDHLRLHALAPGLALTALWHELDRLDTELSERIGYAGDERLGFLTACPSNVGTGLRASVMLHLPALRLLGEIDVVMKGLACVDCDVRGLYGEGSDAVGGMYQISNRMTLGDSEAALLDDLTGIVTSVVQQEFLARGRLLEQRKTAVADHVGRAFGVLRHARLISSPESLDLLSALRFGVSMGMLSGVDGQTFNRVLLQAQPGHLQETAGKELSPAARDALRAAMMQQELSGLQLTG